MKAAAARVDVYLCYDMILYGLCRSESKKREWTRGRAPKRQSTPATLFALLLGWLTIFMICIDMICMFNIIGKSFPSDGLLQLLDFFPKKSRPI